MNRILYITLRSAYKAAVGFWFIYAITIGSR